jgi:6-phosphogluconolactonase (cycloisomerase 2 family)
MHLTVPRPTRLAALALAVCAGALLAACNQTSPDGAADTINSGTSGGNGSINGGGSSGGGSALSYTVGGTIMGLSGSGLILANNAGNDLPVSGNGGFTFSNSLGSGAAYAVTIQSQPVNPSQICAVTNGAGTVSTVNVNSVIVSCTTNFYTVGGVVGGLSGSGLVLQTNGGNNVAVAGSGPYTLATLASGSNYTVTVMTQPINPAQTCTVANDAGVIGAANVTNVAISCTTNSYTIGGAVTGLSGSGLVVQTNGANNVSVSTPGTYTLATLPSGSNFNVTVLTQPTNPSQTCVVSDGSGTVTSANFALVAISCTRIGHAVGRYAFVSDYNADTVTALAIDSITGNLAVINSAPSGVQPYAIAVTPNGAFVYTANSGAADISIFAVNAATGAVTAAGTASTGTGSAPYAVTVDPSGVFVLAADSAGGTLLVFQINQTTGALTQVPGSPFATAPAPGANPSSVTVDPSDQYVFATNQFNPALGLAGYTFNPAPGSGDLTQFPTWQVATGNAPDWVTVDPLDRFVYVSNSLDGTVGGWTIGAGGALTAITGSPFAAGFGTGARPGVIAIDPTGRFLYVTDPINSQVVAFNVDQTTGALTALAGSPFAVGNGAFGEAIDPSGQFMYVGNSYDSTISMFTLNAGSGNLTAVPGSPRTYGGIAPSAIVIE